MARSAGFEPATSRLTVSCRRGRGEGGRNFRAQIGVGASLALLTPPRRRAHHTYMAPIGTLIQSLDILGWAFILLVGSAFVAIIAAVIWELLRNIVCGIRHISRS